MLSGLASHKRNVDLLAGLGNAADYVRDPARDKLAAGYVVGHEKALSTGDDDVIDHHSNEVLTDGVVLVNRLGNGNFGPNPVG